MEGLKIILETFIFVTTEFAQICIAIYFLLRTKVFTQGGGARTRRKCFLRSPSRWVCARPPISPDLSLNSGSCILSAWPCDIYDKLHLEVKEEPEKLSQKVEDLSLLTLTSRSHQKNMVFSGPTTNILTPLPLLHPGFFIHQSFHLLKSFRTKNITPTNSVLKTAWQKIIIIIKSSREKNSWS